MNTKASVLIVDDEQDIREFLFSGLSEEGYLCCTVPKGQDAIAKLKTESFRVALLDIRLPDISGMEILTAIHSLHLDTAAIMTTGINSLDIAVEAMKCGAADFIVKPFSLSKINSSIQRVLESAKRLPTADGQRVIDCNNSLSESYKEMDAIASGVQTRYDITLGYYEAVIRETVAVALQLGMPKNVVQSWAETKSKWDSENKRTIRSSLAKLERSLPAQEVLGLMRPYRYGPGYNDRTRN